MVECGCGCGLEQSNGTEGMYPLNRISELVQEVCVHGTDEYRYECVFLAKSKGNRTECRRDSDSALSPTESPAETHTAHRQAEWKYEYKAACSVWDGVFEGVFWTNQGPSRNEGGNRDDHSKSAPPGHESNPHHQV